MSVFAEFRRVIVNKFTVIRVRDKDRVWYVFLHKISPGVMVGIRVMVVYTISWSSKNINNVGSMCNMSGQCV